jgi:ankyrin repeat protein
MNNGSLLHILAESYNGNDPIGAIQKLCVSIDCYQNSVTPLMKAVIVGNIKMIRALIQCGANPNARDMDISSLSVIDCAILCEKVQAVYILLDIGAHPSIYPFLPLYAESFLSNRRRLREVCMTLLACRFRPTCPFNRDVLNIIARMIWDYRFE